MHTEALFLAFSLIAFNIHEYLLAVYFGTKVSNTHLVNMLVWKVLDKPLQIKIKDHIFFQAPKICLQNDVSLYSMVYC